MAQQDIQATMKKDDFYKALMHRTEHSGYINHTGIRITGLGEGYATGEMDIVPELLNPFGMVHGGALAGLADTVAGHAVCSLGLRCVTSDCHITYLRPATGTMLTCEGTVRKAGHRLCVANASIRNTEHEEVAYGTFQFAVLESIDLID